MGLYKRDKNEYLSQDLLLIVKSDVTFVQGFDHLSPLQVVRKIEKKNLY